MTIAPLTKWLYIGEDDGFNLVHTVVDVSLTTDPKTPWITTFSDVHQEQQFDDGEDSDEDDGKSGMTWRGPMTLFIESFQPLSDPDESHA